MSAAERYRKIVSVLLPASALGMSILLGASGAEAARTPADVAGPATPTHVALRLAAIRDAVSDVMLLEGDPAAAADGSSQVAWLNGWGNGNWKNGWKNWKNNWKNGWNNWNNNWNNWNNNWNNWKNGWHNWFNF